MIFHPFSDSVQSFYSGHYPRKEQGVGNDTGGSRHWRPGLGEFGWGYRWRDIRLADHPDRAKKLTIIIMLPISIFVALFGRTSADLDQIKMLAACAGFFGNAGISGLYSLLALAFPAEARATGSCFVIGMGLGSLLAGLVLAILEIRTN